MRTLGVSILLAFIVVLNGQPIENEKEMEDSPSDYNFVKKLMTWHEADNYCRHWGGRLATVKSIIENGYIVRELKRRWIGSTWIGFNDIKSEGHFSWLYGNSCNKWTNWHGGEPNGGRRENCVEIAHQWGWAGHWNDLDCNQKRYAVCHKSGPKFNCQPAHQVHHVHETHEVVYERVYERVPADDKPAAVEDYSEETDEAKR